MTSSSLIGFGLVLFGVSLATSVLLKGGMLLVRDRLRAVGPWAERRAAALALALPPIIGLAMTLVLGANSAWALYAGTDHCLDHPHHLHLCWVHGTLWVKSPLAVGSLGFLLTFAMARSAGILRMHARARSTVRSLMEVGESADGAARVFIVPSADHFAFTAGIFKPTIFVSRLAWDKLAPQEREALIAHEQAHIAHGDIWKRTVLSILGALGAPVLSRKAIEIFELASERLCDSNASRLVGKPSIVAGAILALAGPRAAHSVSAAAAHAATCEVTDRIHFLFEHGPSGQLAGERLGLALVLASAASIAAGILFAESLHHILETILG